MDKKETTSPEKKAALQAIGEQLTGTDNRSQCARILEAFSRFSLNTFELSRYLDVYHPPARILQLRKAGHEIVTHWQTVVTECGRKHRIGLYVLEARAGQ
jgi:Helix-turn-helix domain